MSSKTETEMTFDCEFCKNTLSSKYRLNEHLKTCSAKKLFDENKVLSIISSSKEYEKDFLKFLFRKALDNFDKKTLFDYKYENLLDDSTFSDTVYDVIKEQNISKIEFLSSVFDIDNQCLKYIYTNSNILTNYKDTVDFLQEKIIKNKSLIDKGYLDTSIIGNRKIITYYVSPMIKGKYSINTNDKIEVIPTVQSFDLLGNLLSEEYYDNNLLDGIEAVKNYKNGKLIEKMSYKQGKLHSEIDCYYQKQPAIIRYNEDGFVTEKYYYCEGINTYNNTFYKSIQNDYYWEKNPSILLYKGNINEDIIEKRYHNDKGQLSRTNDASIIRYDNSKIYELEFHHNGKHEKLAKLNLNENKVFYCLNGVYIQEELVLNELPDVIEVIDVNKDEFNLKSDYSLIKCSYKRKLFIASLEQEIDCKVEEYYKIFKDTNKKIIHRCSEYGPAQRIKNDKDEIIIERYFENGKLNKYNDFCWKEYDKGKNIFSLKIHPEIIVFKIKDLKNLNDDSFNPLKYLYNSVIDNNDRDDYFTADEVYENEKLKLVEYDYDDVIRHNPHIRTFSTKHIDIKSKPLKATYIDDYIRDNPDTTIFTQNYSDKSTLIDNHNLSQKLNIILKFPWDKTSEDEIKFFLDIYRVDIFSNWDNFIYRIKDDNKYNNLCKFLLIDLKTKCNDLESLQEPVKSAIIEDNKINDQLYQEKEVTSNYQEILSEDEILSNFEIFSNGRMFSKEIFLKKNADNIRNELDEKNLKEENDSLLFPYLSSISRNRIWSSKRLIKEKENERYDTLNALFEADEDLETKIKIESELEADNENTKKYYSSLVKQDERDDDFSEIEKIELLTETEKDEGKKIFLRQLSSLERAVKENKIKRKLEQI